MNSCLINNIIEKSLNMLRISSARCKWCGAWLFLKSSHHAAVNCRIDYKNDRSSLSNFSKVVKHFTALCGTPPTDPPIAI